MKKFFVLLIVILIVFLAGCSINFESNSSTSEYDTSNDGYYDSGVGFNYGFGFSANGKYEYGYGYGYGNGGSNLFNFF